MSRVCQVDIGKGQFRLEGGELADRPLRGRLYLRGRQEDKDLVSETEIYQVAKPGPS